MTQKRRTCEWALMRQDDNGQVVEIDCYPSEAQAVARALVFELRGHKQMYWVAKR